jgi:ADP-ribosylglycohydrolase
MNMTNVRAKSRTGLIDKAHGCLLGGLIGDAMGTPSEGLEPAEIDRRLGWIDGFEGDGTDDSIMKYLLADALIACERYANADDWAAQWLQQQDRVGGDKVDRFFASVRHAAAKLRYGVIPRRVALGHMPSSTAAMSIAPVGIVNAGHPQAASAQAQEIASLVHVDEAGFC